MAAAGAGSGRSKCLTLPHLAPLSREQFPAAQAVFPRACRLSLRGGISAAPARPGSAHLLPVSARATGRYVFLQRLGPTDSARPMDRPSRLLRPDPLRLPACPYLQDLWLQPIHPGIAASASGKRSGGADLQDDSPGSAGAVREIRPAGRTCTGSCADGREAICRPACRRRLGFLRAGSSLLDRPHADGMARVGLLVPGVEVSADRRALKPS
jgi:hypothetical protein